MAWFGLIGGPLVCASGIAVMFGASSAAQGVATIPEIIWEAFLGLWLTFKGFKASAITSADTRPAGMSSADAAVAAG